jgi:tetratricopeptide (TPR) repeat protein
LTYIHLEKTNLILTTYQQIHIANNRERILLKIPLLYIKTSDNVNNSKITSMKTFISLYFLLVALSSYGQTEKAKLANEYYQNGETEKAFLLYEELQKSNNNIPLIHSNYLSILLSGDDIKKTEKYLNKAIKYFPNNFFYKSNMVHYYDLTEQEDKKRKYLNGLENQYSSSPYQLSVLAQNLGNQRLYSEAVELYLKARKLANQPTMNALELAAIYRLKSDIPKMISEYMRYAESNPRNLAYIKNLFQSLLENEGERTILEQKLVQKIQQNPNATMYADLLIWLEVQRKNFYAAFIQARALDKRSDSGGNQTMQIGRLALQNDYWDDAIVIFEYLLKTYPDNYNGRQARKELIQARENKAKSSFPIDKMLLRSLAVQYELIYREEGPNPTSLNALRNKALIHAFYLEELDTAIYILNSIIENGRSPSTLIAQCKIDLGDVYLLDGQPWESTLLYSQVEKSNMESPLGFDAKLKNAKLNYYSGNFKLAKSHLDILKDATTREISNDAIAMSLLIKNNTAFDSSDYILKQFAHIQLLAFQNKTDSTIFLLDQLIKKNLSHSIVDECYQELANIYLKEGKYDISINALDQIIQNHADGILGDDALFQKATIKDKYLDRTTEAIELYTQFLLQYPGSMYAADARKKLRLLRGDVLN